MESAEVAAEVACGLSPVISREPESFTQVEAPELTVTAKTLGEYGLMS